MTMRIYDTNEQVLPPVLLRLARRGDDVEVHVVDRAGKRLTEGSLVVFQADGTLRLCSYIKIPGIQTNSHGRIKLDEFTLRNLGFED